MPQIGYYAKHMLSASNSPRFFGRLSGEMRLKTFAAMIAVLSTCRAID